MTPARSRPACSPASLTEATPARCSVRCARASRPGRASAYCTADSQVLDWVRERATGRAFADDLARLWADLGGASEAFVGVDGNGVALAGGAVAATARDWARVALLAADGRAAGRRLLEASWVDAAARPSYPFLAPGHLPSTITAHAGFGYHWWPLDADGHRADRRRQPRAVRRRRPPYRHGRREDLAVALRRRVGRPALARPQLPRAARPARPGTAAHPEGESTP